LPQEVTSGVLSELKVDHSLDNFNVKELYVFFALFLNDFHEKLLVVRILACEDSPKIDNIVFDLMDVLPVFLFGILNLIRPKAA
jgi:hypothetical protein